MIRDRYDPVGLFELVPQLRLAFEPELAELDRLLEDDVVFAQVKADFARRRPRSLGTGRPSTPVEVVLRLLVVKHLYQWSYAQTEHFVNDSLVLRQFCRLGLAPAPDDTTLLRWANCLQPPTLHRLLDRVTELARALKVTRGRKLRLDSTVVETDVHHPSDSTLLADGVRVLSRLLRRAKALVASAPARRAAPPARDVWRDRTRSAKRLARRIGEATARRLRRAREGAAAPAAPDARQGLYRRLLAVARASVRQTALAEAVLAAAPGAAAARLRAGFDRFLPLVERVIRQAERRVLRGERVAATEKVLSLFQPHTALIRRGKARQPTEFGAKLVLDEVEGGVVTRYTLCAGNPDDADSLPPALAHHHRCFGRPPRLVAGDRHFFTLDNERLATDAGVARVVLPKRGQYGRHDAARRQQERARWFRRGERFRSGIEGRISVLRRGFGLRRCRYHGPAGLERWVGLGLLAHNLRAVGRALARRPRGAAA
jgi:transposase, IS5 family